MAGKSYKSVKEEYELLDMLEIGRDELSALADEMEDWRSNMDGTNLERTEKYSMVSDAADVLRQACDSLPEIDDSFEADLLSMPDGSPRKVAVYMHHNKNKRAGDSRQVRLENACVLLANFCQWVYELVDDQRGCVEDFIAEATLAYEDDEHFEDELPETAQPRKDADEVFEELDNIESAANEVESAFSDAEGAEIPGIFR